MEIEEINIRDIKIETANLILRPFKESDIDDLYNYAKVPAWAKPQAGSTTKVRRRPKPF